MTIKKDKLGNLTKNHNLKRINELLLDSGMPFDFRLGILKRIKLYRDESIRNKLKHIVDRNTDQVLKTTNYDGIAEDVLVSLTSPEEEHD